MEIVLKTLLITFVCPSYSMKIFISFPQEANQQMSNFKKTMSRSLLDQSLDFQYQ